MELINFVNLIKQRWGTVMVFTAVFFVLSVVLTLVQPLKYSSNLRLLVVQDVSGSADPYTATKANEYLSEILSKVTYSGAFLHQVLNSGLAVDRAYFGSTPKQIAKNWTKTINVRPVNNTGIIMVAAYHPERDQAERLARAISYVLITQHSHYHGLGDKVIIKLLDDPLTSQYPVKPNLPVNAALSLLVGAVCGLLFIYVRPEKNFTGRSGVLAKEEPAHSQPAAEGDKFTMIQGAAPHNLPIAAKAEPRIDWPSDF